MAKRGSKKSTAPTHLVEPLKSKVIDIMDCLGGDDYAYYELDNIKLGGHLAQIKFQMRVLVKTTNRPTATSQVSKALEDKNIAYVRDGYRLEIPLEPSAASKDKIRLDIKPTGGGSGGGSDETAKNESTQALFCALRWSRNQDLTPETWSMSDLETVLPNCDINPKGTWNDNLEDLLMVDPTWYSSHIKGANLIKNKVKNNTKVYTFHRGSTAVKDIEETYKICNKNITEGTKFSDINKWSPADIYLMSNEFISNHLDKLKECKTMETLNQYIEKLFDSEDLIGISLKKITSGTGSWSVKNHKDIPKDVSQVSFRGFSGTFKSIDLYLKWGSSDKDKIQFRDTTGDGDSWQGEVKGLSAAQGKIGGGIVDGYMIKLFKKELGVGNRGKHATIKTMCDPIKSDTKTTKSVTDDIMELTKNNKGPSLFADFTDNDQTRVDISAGGKKNKSWRYSKYLNLKLLDIVMSLSDQQRHELVRAWYFYAASQSELSAVYAKVM